MRHAALRLATVLQAAALGGIEHFIDSADDIGNRDVRVRPRQTIAAPRPAHAFDQAVAAQPAEQLFEIGQRDLLPLADRRQRDRTIATVQGEINHRGHGKTSFGGQAHGVSCQYLIGLVNYEKVPVGVKYSA